MRLQKYLSASGLCSRREAEKWIEAGRVSVNGVVASLGDKAEEGDVVTVDGKTVTLTASHTYILLHKPRGYVTTMSDERGRPTVAELVQDVGVRVYPVGRLDYASEGLLLMTDDGEIANILMHPSHQIPKTYLVKVRGSAFTEKAERLRRPLTDADGTHFQGAEVEILRSSADMAVLSMTIREGKNREIRRMCALCDLQVLRLRRIRQGSIELRELPAGQWRYLTQEELDYLHSLG